MGPQPPQGVLYLEYSIVFYLGSNAGGKNTPSTVGLGAAVAASSLLIVLAIIVIGILLVRLRMKKGSTPIPPPSRPQALQQLPHPKPLPPAVSRPQPLLPPSSTQDAAYDMTNCIPVAANESYGIFTPPASGGANLFQAMPTVGGESTSWLDKTLDYDYVL